jgi:hypothetical protein
MDGYEVILFLYKIHYTVEDHDYEKPEKAEVFALLKYSHFM